ncbi:Rho family-interacting cell polarization regulator 2 [Camelus dromedarius]|uniref:Ferritin light chain n=1 Tax=Camelus dromedarius TaxID=9838 RepID=A0A5N4DCT0_CAMDR|nr:Rho family-interacting cell polarization regulator 2 [Camelus dromedarius]
MSSKIHQDYSAKVEATINRLVYLHLQIPYTYLSQGFYFDCKHEVQKLSQNDLGKTLDAMEATMALEEKPNQAFLDLHALVYVHTDPYPYDFLGSNFLNEQVKLVKKMATT